jgi:hypothetical protein
MICSFETPLLIVAVSLSISDAVAVTVLAVAFCRGDAR